MVGSSGGDSKGELEESSCSGKGELEESSSGEGKLKESSSIEGELDDNNKNKQYLGWLWM